MNTTEIENKTINRIKPNQGADSGIEDWVECTLGEVCSIQTGKYDASHAKPDGKYRFYTCAFDYLKCDTNRFKGKSIILPGNGANVGEVFFYDGEFDAYQRTYVLNQIKINEKYLYFHLLGFWKTINLDKQFGTATNYIRMANFTDYIIPVYPLPIQRAIVKKIEELFSSLDSGIADLKKAQEQLVIYRQAVLKKAFEGELTKEWREKQTNLPTADELLEQIKDERQKHYEQQIAQWKEAVTIWEKNDKQGKKPNKPKIYKDYNSPVRSLNLETPKEWVLTCIGNACSKTEYGSSSKSLDIGDVPVIRMGNMQNGKIDWSDLKFSTDQNEINQYLLKTGDVLFNRTNSPELVGKTVLYNGERPAIFAGYLIRLNQIESIINGKYLNYFLNSHPAKVYGSYVKTDGVNQSNINGEKLSKYPLPIPQLKEQHAIIREIESRLSVCDKVEESIKESLLKAEALRLSILKKAFEGTLLSEEEIATCKADRDYEPASVLLEKIKAGNKN